MDTSLTVPIISDAELSEVSANFLSKYGKLGQSPIDIEKICEQEGVGLVVVPLLPNAKNIEAYIANQCETIVIDQNVFETQIDRARFTLAHELSHRILHSPHLEQFPITDPESYQRFHEVVSADALTTIEDQAYSLAGHLLMPTDLLNLEIESLIAAENTSLMSESAIRSIIQRLVALFMVSADALIRQIRKVNMAFYSLISPENYKILVPPYIKPLVAQANAIR
jgi:Zn-dependent peptidase ImmA (M78 family)